MMVRQDHEHTLRPQEDAFAIRPVSCSSDEGDVEIELRDRCDMICGVPVSHFDSHRAMSPAVNFQQLRQKAGSDRGINTDPDTSLFRTTCGGNLSSAFSNSPDDPAGVYEESLAGIGLRYAPCMPVKQGGANLVFQLGNDRLMQLATVQPQLLLCESCHARPQPRNSGDGEARLYPNT
jgi:hypothetical protein